VEIFVVHGAQGFPFYIELLLVRSHMMHNIYLTNLDNFCTAYVQTERKELAGSQEQVSV
jgi:hypothetical protein